MLKSVANAIGDLVRTLRDSVKLIVKVGRQFKDRRFQTLFKLLAFSGQESQKW